MLQVDLISPLLLARLLLPGMLERGYGRIVNVSSLAGHTSFPHTEAYAAAKDGLTAFSRVLHSDYRRTGVSATSLILGPVKDAGISARTLAETGLTASAAFSVSPARVAAATVRAIDKPKPETIVSVGPGRALKALMDYFPGLGPRLNRLSGADKLMTAVADYREAMAVDDVGGGLHRAAVMGGTQSGHVEQLPSESLSAAPTAKAPYAIFTASCPEQSTRPSAGKPGRVGQASHLQPSDHPGYLTLRAAARLGAGICGHRTATTSP